MSLSRKDFKEGYNRAAESQKVNRELNPSESRYDDDYIDHYDDSPSMYEITWGRMLHLLQNLKIKSSTELLDHWYW
jgi:hypothetical protein